MHISLTCFFNTLYISLYITQPTVSYCYGDTVKRKILNYNKIIQSDEVADNFSCNCDKSSFRYEVHKHFVKGDLNFMEDKDLRRLFWKGLNFRLPQQRNLEKALNSFKIKIIDYIEKIDYIEIYYIEKISKKFKVAEVIFNGWKTKLLERIQLNLSKISTNFVFISTDKSSNNISIVCKKFYLMNIENEQDSSFTLY